MASTKNGHVIRQESKIVWVDFGHKPDPPTPKFPGANGLRPVKTEECQSQEVSVAKSQ